MCAYRWRQHLDPSIDRSPFTADEDRTIVRLQADRKTAGGWDDTAKSLPGRTAKQIRDRGSTI